MSFNVTRGEAVGRRISGTLRAIGSDCLTVHPNGSGLLDLRVAIETDDGALIHATYEGPFDLGPEAHRRALQGIALGSGLPFQIAPRFHSRDAAYHWLNDLPCIGLGQISPARGTARCEVYAVLAGDAVTAQDNA